jgi:hypothetical protein
MASTNEHYIPRFLLRGFASSKKGTETYTFLFRRGLEPLETNIRNVGAEFEFYTGDRSADKALQSLESQLAKCIARLRDATRETQVTDSIIPELVVHVMLRNKCLREAMLRLVKKTTAVIKDRIQNPETLPKYLRAAISQRPVEFVAAFQEGARRAKINPEWSLKMFDYALRNPSVLSALSSSEEVDKYFENIGRFLSANFPELLKASHIEGLINTTLPKQWVEAIEDWNWCLMIRDRGTFILGDVGPMFKVLGSALYKTIPSGLHEYEFGYLPISDTHLLVGFAEDLCDVDAEEINIASAAGSSEFFVSSRNTHRKSKYREVLGSNIDLIPDQEVGPILDGFFSPS